MPRSNLPLLLMLAAPAALAPSSGFAACILTGATLECTGDVSGGAQRLSPPVSTINVHSLTHDVAPGANIPGIGLLSVGGDGGSGASPDLGNPGNDLTINFDPPGADPNVAQSGAYPGFGPVAAALLAMPDIPALANAYNVIGDGRLTSANPSNSCSRPVT